jgi:prevent-host-death family protein
LVDRSLEIDMTADYHMSSVILYFVRMRTDVYKRRCDMREDAPVTQIIKASDTRQQWSGLLNKVFRKEVRVVVEKSGIPVAGIVSADDLERLIRLEADRAERFTAIDRIREAFSDVPDAELVAEVANAVAATRVKGSRTQRRG